MKLRLYLADMVEPQANGKLAVLGLYADLVVVIHAPPGTPEASPEAAYGLDVCLLLSLSDLPTGGAHAEMLVYPSQQENAPVLQGRFTFEVLEPGAGVNVPMPLRPLPVPVVGPYTVEVRVGNEVLRETFEVRVRVDPAAPPPILLARPPARGAGAAAAAPPPPTTDRPRED